MSVLSSQLQFGSQKGNADLYHIASAAGIAAICGGAAAVIVLFTFYRRSKMPPAVTITEKIDWNGYFHSILLFGIVQALTHMVLLIIQFADTFTLLPGLMDHGFSKLEAMEEKGIFDRGQPLIQFGMVMGSSFALALVPNMAKSRLQEHETVFMESVRTALSVGFYIAAGASIGLILLFPEINLLLYRDVSGTYSLQFLMLAVVLSSLAITGSSILQALGYVKQTAIFILIAFICKWAANHVFVVWWGITGSALATVLALALLCILVMSGLKQRLRGFSWVRQIYWQAFFYCFSCDGRVYFLM
ncbi:polysaccharide biosynthesis C-terminal domain-containing protein [Virgibacillus halophilus]|uniref:Polysaccharide biosynthesis C-terminal domain-containing protein n=1 Tax=Tigheibacillus halophilus TaxID=361280 RepID=A0ABU5C859_9BACI|nr:polysaccharide biosynthesis C-terminal domain-containing protein [Virgibacillus halophilus]